MVGTGGSTAKMDVWRGRQQAGEAIGTGIPVHVGEAGMAPEARDSVPATRWASTPSTSPSEHSPTRAVA